MKHQLIKHLSSHQLKATAHRLRVLEYIYQFDKLVDAKAILQKVSGSMDRVTLYRNLKTLVDHNVIHKVDMGANGTYYGASSHLPSEHGHFYCSDCDHIFCIPQTTHHVELPTGFLNHSSSVIVNGLCGQCNHV